MGERAFIGSVGLVGVVFFLCLHSFAARGGWWVWVRVIGVRHKSFVAFEHTVGFTFNTV